MCPCRVPTRSLSIALAIVEESSRVDHAQCRVPPGQVDGQEENGPEQGKPPVEVVDMTFSDIVQDVASTVSLMCLLLLIRSMRQIWLGVVKECTMRRRLQLRGSMKVRGRDAHAFFCLRGWRSVLENLEDSAAISTDFNASFRMLMRCSLATLCDEVSDDTERPQQRNSSLLRTRTRHNFYPT